LASKNPRTEWRRSVKRGNPYNINVSDQKIMIKYPFTFADLPKNIDPSDHGAYEAEIEWFNDDEDIKELYSVIDNKIFHRCSISDFLSIVKDDFIYPNTGRYKYKYPQSKTNISGLNNWISLFNFNKTPFQIMTTYENWRQFLTDCGNCTILILLNNTIGNELIKNPFCGNKNLPTSKCIAYVEEWCATPISVQVFEKIIFVPSRQPHQYVSCNWENVHAWIKET